MIELKPMVTVIAPVYNGESFICSFIESIIRQSYENWELILVDDGSTDSTVHLIKQYSDERIKLILRPDDQKKGADTCRNIGIKNISGDYFIILDSDDIVESYCIEQRAEFMGKNRSVDFGIFPGKTLIMSDDGGLKKGYKLWGRKTRIPPIISLLKADYNFGVWNVIFRSETMSGILWDEDLKIYMDFDYLFRILINNYKYAYADDAKPDYGYIQGRANAITSSFVSDEKYNSTKYLLNKTLKELTIRDEKKYIRCYYHFFLSLYRRIVHSGNYDIYMDYIGYYKQTYNKRANIRLNILDAYCSKKLKNNIKIGRSFDYFIILIFHPLEIVPKLISRIIAHYT